MAAANHITVESDSESTDNQNSPHLKTEKSITYSSLVGTRWRIRYCAVQVAKGRIQKISSHYTTTELNFTLSQRKEVNFITSLAKLTEH